MSEKRQDSPPEGGSSPPKNLGLKTQDSQSWGMTRDCTQCANVTAAWNGPADLLLCANHPDRAGLLTVVACGDCHLEDVGARCRSFRVRREGGGEVPANGEVRHIGLTGGLFAIVDAADFEALSRYHWRATRGDSSYACCTIGGKRVCMHRLIMDPPAGMVVDHINGNRWDNRRGNLRVCTQAENIRNRRKSRGTSRFKGVFWDAIRRKWRVMIRCDGKTVHMGRYDDEVQAAKAYDRAALRLFGPYARLNFPEPTHTVWLSGRICARSCVRGRLTTKTLRYQRHDMPALRVGMTPGRCHSERSRGIRSQMEGTFFSGPDVSTALRAAGPERGRGAQHDKNMRHDNPGWARYVRRRASAASRGPPDYLTKHALGPLD